MTREYTLIWTSAGRFEIKVKVFSTGAVDELEDEKQLL